MRFHCGFSFSWRTIKKFLIPFILGIFAILGFNFIYDKESLPLGFIPVYAEEIDDITENDIPDEIQENYNYWSSILSFEEEQSVVHKPLFNKLYWFDDNTTELGVLSSIYELLFLYCLTMIIFRIMTYIKNTRW